MQPSSLFLRPSTTFVTFITLLSSVFAAPTSTATAAYSLQTSYSGSNFFSGFSFFTDADPTHGFVTYVGQSQAQSMGLISAADGSPVRIGVDYTNKYDGTKAYSGVNGVGRPSVRITSNQKYNHGLFIADIANMPGGVCGTWPALWTLGDGSWPSHGEIDIIEGVHTQTQSLTSLHTAGKCNVPSYPSTETGTIQTTNCTYDTKTGTNSAGCGVLDDDTSSFGLPFNSMGGGVFAWEWTSNSIRSWFFRRGKIPSDITSGNPKPSGWGTPYVNFLGDCSIDSNFVNHQIVLDTTFCGDWAGAVWGDSCASSTGVSSCSVYVGNNPSAFKNMYWSINSINVYSNATSTTTTSSTAQTSTSSSKTAISSSTTTSVTTTSKSLSTVSSTLTRSTLTTSSKSSATTISSPTTSSLSSSSKSSAISPSSISSSSATTMNKSSITTSSIVASSSLTTSTKSSTISSPSATTSSSTTTTTTSSITTSRSSTTILVTTAKSSSVTMNSNSISSSVSSSSTTSLAPSTTASRTSTGAVSSSTTSKSPTTTSAASMSASTSSPITPLSSSSSSNTVSRSTTVSSTPSTIPSTTLSTTSFTTAAPSSSTTLATSTIATTATITM